MKRIYQAAHSVEAHMIVHMLEQSGVRAHIQGEHLQSGAGELPVGNLVAVAVEDEDVSAARNIIRDWEALNATPSESDAATPSRFSFATHSAAFLVGAVLAGGVVWATCADHSRVPTPRCSSQTQLM